MGAYVQSSYLEGGASTATVPSNPLTVSAGNLLVCMFCWDISAGSAPAITGVTDTRGNPWVFACGQTVAANSQRFEFWYVENCLAGSTTVTGTVAVIVGNQRCSFIEVSGIALSGALDKVSTAETGTGNTTITTGTVLPDRHGEYLVGALQSAAGGAPASQSGWTQRVVSTSGEGHVYDQSQVSGIPVAFALTGLTSGALGAMLATFRSTPSSADAIQNRSTVSVKRRLRARGTWRRASNALAGIDLGQDQAHHQRGL